MKHTYKLSICCIVGARLNLTDVFIRATIFGQAQTSLWHKIFWECDQHGRQKETGSANQGRTNPADERNTGEKVMTAIEFQASHRGKFIQAQALYYAIQKLSEVPGVMREVSNIADMQYLLDALYPGYEEIFDHIDTDIRTVK